MGEPTIAAQVKALQRMTIAELQQRWLEVFGKPTRQRDREAMWKRLAQNLQGEPDEGAVIAPATHRKSAPRATQSPRRRPRRPLRDRRLPPPGAAIIRTYRGHDLTVKILDKGFEYQGQVYRSLSAVAREITGAHWNGYLFFALIKEMKR